MQITRYETTSGNKLVSFRQDASGKFYIMLCDNYNTPYYRAEKEYKTDNRTKALKKYFDYVKEIEQ